MNVALLGFGVVGRGVYDLTLDRSDINADEIIPAKYLTELTKEALKPYCLEDLNLPPFNPKTDIADKSVIITRANFGCGSSREHAPIAIKAAGVSCVIAETFARIEGILPAPESSHAIKVAIDEAMKCKETGEKKVILLGLSGTGFFDMPAYKRFNDGEMSDYIPSDEDLQKGFATLPRI